MNRHKFLKDKIAVGGSGRFFVFCLAYGTGRNAEQEIGNMERTTTVQVIYIRENTNLASDRVAIRQEEHLNSKAETGPAIGINCVGCIKDC